MVRVSVVGAALEFTLDAVRQRESDVNSAPDRLSIDPRSPHYDEIALERGLIVEFRGTRRSDIFEYCISEGWVRVPVGKVRDRQGIPLTVKLSGPVEAIYMDMVRRAGESSDG